MRTWTITKNHIEPDAQLVTRATKTTKQMLEQVGMKAADFAKKNGEHFKLYDDDGILYVEGYIWQCEDDHPEAIFNPLDYFMCEYGATEMKMRSKRTNKYETV